MKFELWYPCKPLGFNQKFGNPSPMYSKIGLKGHNGIDFFAPDGTPVRTAHDGMVTYAGEDGSGGLTIVIRTMEQYAYLDSNAFFKTIYCHFKTGTLKVAGGDMVKVGDIIGLADNTGMSTGSHLHFGLKPVAPGEQDWMWYNLQQDNGYLGAIDPEPYFNGYFAEDTKVVVSALNSLISLLKKCLQLLKPS